MNIFLKKKISSEKFDPATLNEVTKTLRAIFSRTSHYDTEHKREKLLNIHLSDEFSNDQLDEIKEAHLFVTDYFKTKNMIYHIIQIDRGKNFELAADCKTAILSPLANTAKLIPAPIVGHAVAGGIKKALKCNSDKRRIERAKKKSGYMPPDNGMIDFITLLFVKVHLAKIKYDTITTFYENLNEELDIFFSVAKKQMGNNPDSKNLKDFWADVFSTYLQDTVLNHASSEEFFSINVSLTDILNKDLKPLLNTIENSCATLYPENKKKTASDPLCSTANNAQNVAVASDDPRPPTLDPQPGPEITCTLNPTLSPQYLPTNNNHPNSLIMNLVIPDHQGNNPITLYIPISNQPMLINLLPATKPAVYTPHASASITYPSVLSNPSPQATTPSLSPYTNITISDRAEENLITIPVPMVSSSMNKTETPQLFSKEPTPSPVNLNQLQGIFEAVAYIGSVMLAKKNQVLYTKQDLLDKKTPRNISVKSNYSSFFSYGAVTQQINTGVSPYLSPAVA